MPINSFCGCSESDTLSSRNSSVSVGSPASTAGFRIDDVITAMDGRPVRDLDELVSFLALYYSPGDVFNITVLRNGQTLTLSGVVGERP